MINLLRGLFLHLLLHPAFTSCIMARGRRPGEAGSGVSQTGRKGAHQDIQAVRLKAKARKVTNVRGRGWHVRASGALFESPRPR